MVQTCGRPSIQGFSDPRWGGLFCTSPGLDMDLALPAAFSNTCLGRCISWSIHPSSLCPIPSLSGHYRQYFMVLRSRLTAAADGSSQTHTNPVAVAFRQRNAVSVSTGHLHSLTWDRSAVPSHDPDMN